MFDFPQEKLLVAGRHGETVERRLRRASLRAARPSVRRPGFDPAALGCGILHLGCGAFHRGHQAVATQRAIEAEGKAGMRWGIAAVSMTRSTVPDQLRPQDGLYTALERRESGTTAEIIGALREIVHAPSDRKGLAERIADPETRLVSLTITPTGYLLEPTTGRLNAGHRDVVHDLRHPDRPRSAVGAIAYGLAKVRERGHTPPVILSCDNLTDNGPTLRRAVANFAALRDDSLAAWIESHVRFPATMVDRIVPATTAEDREDAERLIGLKDAAPVSMEPFMQWVIEDFEGLRPRWEEGGATFVDDVRPFELAKLRLLNGVHMLLAYLGGVAGFRTISETVSDPLFAALAETFMLHEQGATLSMARPDLHAYVEKLMERLRNPAIRHDVGRIGRNGSVKMATRLIQPLRENLVAGRSCPATILTVAAWIRWFAARETRGMHVHLTDPRKEMLIKLAAETAHDPMRQAREFFALRDVFGPELPNHDAVAEELGGALRDLQAQPMRDVLRSRLTRNRLGQ